MLHATFGLPFALGLLVWKHAASMRSYGEPDPKFGGSRKLNTDVSSDSLSADLHHDGDQGFQNEINMHASS
tara:strand:- start:858 stop:1070 length:213 start_codon:yes stop_codon:yes gene_type:complete